MAEGGYKSPATVGGKVGCVAAALVGIPIFIVLLMVAAMGDCISGEPCPSTSMLLIVLPPAAVAGMVGLAVRWLINRLVARRDRGNIQVP